MAIAEVYKNHIRKVSKKVFFRYVVTAAKKAKEGTKWLNSWKSACKGIWHQLLGNEESSLSRSWYYYPLEAGAKATTKLAGKLETNNFLQM